MGVWIEFRCADRGEPWSEGSKGERCLSHDNAGPMGMADDNMEAIKATYADLSDAARRSGWKKKRRGWVCPFCSNASEGGQHADR